MVDDGRPTAGRPGTDAAVTTSRSTDGAWFGPPARRRSPPRHRSRPSRRATPATFDVRVPIGGGGYVGTELRGEPTIDADDPLASEGDVRALTNPIFLTTAADTAPDGRDAGRVVGDRDDPGTGRFEQYLRPRGDEYAVCRRRGPRDGTRPASPGN